jgi:hypothetical protein
MDDIVQGSELYPEPTAKQEPKVEPIKKVGIVGACQMGR